MGCCESCANGEDKDYDTDGPRETDRLINPANGPSQADSFGETQIQPQPTSMSEARGDEQSALSRILHQTASNVIDVAPVEGRGRVEQQEFHDKARQYSNKVNMILSSSGRHRQYKAPLPNGVVAPQVILTAQPISLADIDLINSAAMKAAQAIKDVKVEHKEDLVVPFGVP